MKYKTKRRVAKFKRKARQVRGKLRRFFLDKFKKSFIHRQVATRVGACAQCGRCCSLVYRCPFLKQEGDKTKCLIYALRPAQCRHFPIDQRDLKEVLPTACGYAFTKPGDKL